MLLLRETDIHVPASFKVDESRIALPSVSLDNASLGTEPPSVFFSSGVIRFLESGRPFASAAAPAAPGGWLAACTLSTPKSL